MAETKYIFVTGGVASSLGKGIISSSIGKLLQARGYSVTIQKFDPYINIAVSVIEECSGGPGRHAYLQEVKAGGAFGEDLRRDRKKYHLPEA